LFLDALHLFLAPDTVLAVSRLGWRRRCGESRRYPVAAGDGDSWPGLVEAFAAALADFDCRRVRIVLSQHLVQYCLLPWRDDLKSDEEYLASARLEFSGTFDRLADRWTIVLGDAAPGQARIAAAMPEALLTALQAAATAAGKRLQSAQPYLGVAVNAWRAHLPGNAGQWLLVYEPGRLLSAYIEAGQWRWLRHQRAGAGWQQDLEEFLGRERMLAGISEIEAPVTLLACGAPAALPSTGDLEVIDLSSRGGFPPEQDGAFAAAWLG
jgi:hypothetical protein